MFDLLRLPFRTRIILRFAASASVVVLATLFLVWKIFFRGMAAQDDRLWNAVLLLVITVPSGYIPGMWRMLRDKEAMRCAEIEESDERSLEIRQFARALTTTFFKMALWILLVARLLAGLEYWGLLLIWFAYNLLELLCGWMAKRYF